MCSFHASFMLVALALLPCAAHAQSPTPAPTDPAPQYGWLEGTITTEQGNPVQETSSGFGLAKSIKLVRHGGGAYTIPSDLSMGGFYSNHTLKPGIYDISVTTGYWGNTGSMPYRPQRVLGIVIKPGQRTLLNIIMPQGLTLEETGQPAVVSAPATNVTEELARMQKQIDDLKQQVATLLKATAAPASAPAAAAKP